MFLTSLPPELRVQVYNVIIERTFVTKFESPHAYRGLILSCKEVHAEYTFEADKSVKPIDNVIQSKWGYSRLKLHLSGYIVTMQVHVSIPHKVLKLDEDPREGKIGSIIPSLLANRTRVVFSLYDYDSPAHLNRDNSPLDIEWDWFDIALLYNILCWVIPKYTGERRARMSYGTAANRWEKKGYYLVGKSNAPTWRCEHVALHAQNRIVVYDAHMSDAELEGASSGHLWTNTAPERRI